MWLANARHRREGDRKGHVTQIYSALCCAASITCEKTLAAFSKRAVFYAVSKNHLELSSENLGGGQNHDISLSSGLLRRNLVFTSS